MLWCRVSALESKLEKRISGEPVSRLKTFCLRVRRRLKQPSKRRPNPGAVGRVTETISSLKLLERNSAPNRVKEKNRLPSDV
jgi:hypothetical protein